VKRTAGRFGLLFAAILGVGEAAAECTESSPLHRYSAAFTLPSEAADPLPKWGYGYDSLLADLEAWKRSPYVTVDSIGASVQGRAIWQVTITEGGDSLGREVDPGWRKRRIFVHARTHPAEVQTFHIARSMIRFLLDTGEAAGAIRREHIVNILPMYNPDGVELMHPRENANGIDIESNWNKPVLETEVSVLKGHFERLMAGPIPVEVALNLHSDRFNCTRFFFFHEAAGTSEAFVELEKDYIGKVRGYFPTGIREWHFVRSWELSTGTQYPEGWWWINHRERVMALTFEDANCPGAGEFDSTARALVLGSADYLEARPASLRPRSAAAGEASLLRTHEGFRVMDVRDSGWKEWVLADLSGRRFGSGRFRERTALIPSRLLGGSPLVLHLSGSPDGGPGRLLLPAW
jgi:hypothetical protein